ncbi:hypothetical protein Lal_00030207 [Lupinus albus]|nr:hypothetical protein Lal_00030207 [Lupinus albus]
MRAELEKTDELSTSLGNTQPSGSKEKGKAKVDEGTSEHIEKPTKLITYLDVQTKQCRQWQFKRFVDICRKLHINIPLVVVLDQMLAYVKLMKELLTKKNQLLENETLKLDVSYSTIIQKFIPPKSKDHGSFTMPVTIENLPIGKVLLDLRASNNILQPI